jgi:hypothetical protein
VPHAIWFTCHSVFGLVGQIPGEKTTSGFYGFLKLEAVLARQFLG